MRPCTSTSGAVLGSLPEGRGLGSGNLMLFSSPTSNSRWPASAKACSLRATTCSWSFWAATGTGVCRVTPRRSRIEALAPLISEPSTAVRAGAASTRRCWRDHFSAGSGSLASPFTGRAGSGLASAASSSRALVSSLAICCPRDASGTLPGGLGGSAGGAGTAPAGRRAASRGGAIAGCAVNRARALVRSGVGSPLSPAA